MPTLSDFNALQVELDETKQKLEQAVAALATASRSEAVSRTQLIELKRFRGKAFFSIADGVTFGVGFWASGFVLGLIPMYIFLLLIVRLLGGSS